MRPVDIVADKQSYKLTMTVKVGDKEMLKARPYTLLSTTLTTTPTNFAAVRAPVRSAEAQQRKPGKGRRRRPIRGRRPTTPNRLHFSRDLSKTDIRQIKGELSVADTQAQVSELAEGAIRRATRSPHPPRNSC